MRHINTDRIGRSFSLGTINAVWQKGIIYREMARFYLAQNDYNSAIKYATIAIEHRNEVAAAFFYRGLAHRKNGNYTAAIEDFDKAIEVNAHYTRAYYELGKTLTQLGYLEKALLYYKEALRQQPGSKKLKDLIAELTVVLSKENN